MLRLLPSVAFSIARTDRARRCRSGWRSVKQRQIVDVSESPMHTQKNWMGRAAQAAVSSAD